jgi:hypothetical protein
MAADNDTDTSVLDLEPGGREAALAGFEEFERLVLGGASSPESGAEAEATDDDTDPDSTASVPPSDEEAPRAAKPATAKDVPDAAELLKELRAELRELKAELRGSKEPPAEKAEPAKTQTWESLAESYEKIFDDHQADEKGRPFAVVSAFVKKAVEAELAPIRKENAELREALASADLMAAREIGADRALESDLTRWAKANEMDADHTVLTRTAEVAAELRKMAARSGGVASVRNAAAVLKASDAVARRAAAPATTAPAARKAIPPGNGAAPRTTGRPTGPSAKIVLRESVLDSAFKDLDRMSRVGS